MSVNTHLISLASNLVLSDAEKISISKSITTLKTRLEGYFGSGITEHFQFGSSTRGTILPRKADSKSDIDYMIVFNTVDGQKKPQTYLDRLKTFAEKRYSTSEIFQSHPTIVLSLNHIKFELVPAINNYGYQIPSPASSWTEWTLTNPTEANNQITDKNKVENNQIKPLVRLVKYWNATQGYPYTSFWLEQYIVNKYFWSCTSLKDYFYAFWSDFNCSPNTANYIKEKVERAKKYAAQAKKYEDEGMAYAAETEIKRIVPSL